MRKLKLMALAVVVLGFLMIERSWGAAAAGSGFDRPSPEERLKQAVDIPWKYLRFYIYSWNTYDAVGSNGSDHTRRSVNLYAPALIDAIYGILYDPDSSTEDMRHILSVPRFAREVINTQRAGAGGILTMPASSKEEAAVRYDKLIDECLTDATEKCLASENWLQAYKIISVYNEKNPAEASLLRERVRDQAERKVREYGRSAVSLTAVDPDLYAVQVARAQGIIEKFLPGDPIRTHLDALWAEVSAIPAPVVPTEAALAEHRELMGRLAEEE